MAEVDFYRGGNSLKPRLRELRIDSATGLVLPIRGVSVFSQPDDLDRFGGPFKITNVPPELVIIQKGQDPNHHEIVPAQPMLLSEYEEALAKIVLVPV